MSHLIIVPLIILFLFCSLIIFAPFYVVVKGGYEEKIYGVFSVIWLWGAFKADYLHKERQVILYLASKKILKKTLKEKKSEKVKILRKQRPKKKRNMTFADFSFISKVSRKIFQSLSPQGKVQGVIGLRDPAETGFLTGVIAFCMSFTPISINVLADFVEEKLIFNGWFKFRVMIASILFIAAKCILSKKGREILGNL
jgi:hypothetical protein